MSTYLTAAALADYLGVDEDAALRQIVQLTGDLIDEELAGGPASPTPAWVIAIAWNVAIRAGSNPKGVTSQTRSWDDITKTERWEAQHGSSGVYLTADERARLNGVIGDGDPAYVPARSIRMNVPGWNGDSWPY